MPSDILDVIAYNNTLRYALNPTFHRVFSIGLGEFWDNIIGLNIVGLDDALFGDTDVSMHDNVQAKFGETGVNLLRKCLGQVDISPEEYQEASKWLPKHHLERYQREKKRRDLKRRIEKIPLDRTPL